MALTVQVPAAVNVNVTPLVPLTLQTAAEAVATVKTTAPPGAVALSVTGVLLTVPDVGGEDQVMICDCEVKPGAVLSPPPQAVTSNADAIALAERMRDWLMFFKGCLRNLVMLI